MWKCEQGLRAGGSDIVFFTFLNDSFGFYNAYFAIFGLLLPKTNFFFLNFFLIRWGGGADGDQQMWKIS